MVRHIVLLGQPSLQVGDGSGKNGDTPERKRAEYSRFDSAGHKLRKSLLSFCSRPERQVSQEFRRSGACCHSKKDLLASPILPFTAAATSFAGGQKIRSMLFIKR
jgi:hypothetical protein